MGSFLKCIFVLTTAALLAAQRHQRDDMITCHKEIGELIDTCVGKYCYKMHTPDDSAGDGIVKKGCMNALDAQTEVGKCTSRPLEEGGAELMCVCRQRNFCNSALSTFSVIPVLFSILVYFSVSCMYF
uniref:Activin_recp domain-containing protein n=1 Tax=Caenorhabditis japonica TaxID=281687 RepID=A0A8R1I6X8_CAEJA